MQDLQRLAGRLEELRPLVKDAARRRKKAEKA